MSRVYPFLKRWMRVSKQRETTPKRAGTSAFELTSIAARYSDLPSAVAGCCERLVTADASGADHRARLVRLTGSLLGMSFIASSAIALVAASTLGVAGVLAAVSATLAMFWLAALLVASGKGERIIPALVVAVCAAGLPVVLSVGGGLGSPLALLLAALVVEPVWADRTRAARIAGGIALAAALVGVAAMPAIAPIASGPVVGAYWIPALAYLGFVAARYLPAKARGAHADQGEEAILQATGALVLRLSTGGDVASAKGRTREMLGVPAEILLGGGLFERIRVSDRVGFLCALGETQAGAPAKRVSALVRMPSEDAAEPASHRLFDFELVATTDGSGDVLALVRHDGEVERLTQELAEAERRRDAMDMVRSRLLASVSHELRTPLNAIIGFSDMLLLELFGKFNDPRQKEYVTLVRDSGHHLLEVVNSILDVSKIESGAYSIVPEPFVLGDAMEMCRSMMDGQAQAKSIRLSVSTTSDLTEVVADRRAVQQMLINLVSNAIKFTPAGGAVSIKATRSGALAKLAVIDNGIGIAEQDLARIGEPFTQVYNDYTRQFDGAGLGLSLVKGLVNLHGGSMTIESAPGQGTTVTIALPVDGSTAPKEAEGKIIALGKPGPRNVSHGSLRKTA